MEDIFINRLPTIDLHGYDTASAKVATNDFISDNIILKKDKIIIIHGIGTGVLKSGLQDILRRNRHVKSQRAGQYGEGGAGVTIVTLK